MSAFTIIDDYIVLICEKASAKYVTPVEILLSKYTGEFIGVKNSISISINKSTLQLSAGASEKLTVTASPAGTSVTWKSSNSKIATVDKTGLVNAISTGSTKITATAGGKIAECLVTVIPTIEDHPFDISVTPLFDDGTLKIEFNNIDYNEVFFGDRLYSITVSRKIGNIEYSNTKLLYNVDRKASARFTYNFNVPFIYGNNDFIVTIKADKFEETATKKVNSSYVTLKCDGPSNRSTYTQKISFNKDALFANNAVPNLELSLLSAVASKIVYTEKYSYNAYDTPPQDGPLVIGPTQEAPYIGIGEFMSSLGFTNIKTANYGNGYKDDNQNKVAYAFGHQKLSNGGTLVAVFIRGTIGNEWYSNMRIVNPSDVMGKESNVRVGRHGDIYYPYTGAEFTEAIKKLPKLTTDVHYGFDKAASDILASLYDYVAKIPDFQGNKNNVIWLTGHSRGAAVANILSRKVSNSIASSSFAEKNVYTYLFAPPATNTYKTDPYARKPVVHGLINEYDMVPLMPAKEWGFKLFGNNNTVDKFTPIDKEKDTFETRTNSIYKVPSPLTTERMGRIFGLTPSVSAYYYLEYYDKDKTLYNFMSNGLADVKSRGSFIDVVDFFYKPATIFDNDALYVAKQFFTAKLLSPFNHLNNMHALSDAHTMDMYIIHADYLVSHPVK